MQSCLSVYLKQIWSPPVAACHAGASWSCYLASLQCCGLVGPTVWGTQWGMDPVVPVRSEAWQGLAGWGPVVPHGAEA
jgi:hypothetical protein